MLVVQADFFTKLPKRRSTPLKIIFNMNTTCTVVVEKKEFEVRGFLEFSKLSIFLIFSAAARSLLHYIYDIMMVA